jgi:hypothetical protein
VIVAPASRNTFMNPARSAAFAVAAEIGVTNNRTPGWTLRPSRTSAASARSDSLPLEQDPMLAACTSNPATALTGRTRVISCGPATRFSNVDRS